MIREIPLRYIQISGEEFKKIKSYAIDPIYDNQVIKNPGGDDGPKDKRSGHGTHVAGSVLGDGSSSIAANNNMVIRGIAYEAQVVFQAVEQYMNWTDAAILYFKNQGKQPPEYGLFGLPEDISELFEFTYQNGCRIHTNSWGSVGSFGEYDNQCLDLDKFVWEHKDFAVLFAAW